MKIEAASGLGFQAFQWIGELDDPLLNGANVLIEQPQWEALASKLKVAILEIAKGEDRRRMEIAITDCSKNNICISGRFLLWMLYRSFDKKKKR